MNSKSLVYIVDKDSDAQVATANSFTGKGYEVQAFTDGPKLLNSISFSKSPLRPSFFIIDVLSGGGLGGFETVKRISELYDDKSVPILMCAKHFSIEDDREAQDAGAVCCLRKPVKLDEVLSAIENDRTRRQRLRSSAKVER